jgi:hypothetical protein
VKNCKRCEKTFETKVTYQIYCSDICREQATKEKIASRYIVAKRQKRIGKVRKCKNCENDLSIYNDEPICTFCLINPVEVVRALKKLRIIINDKE